MLLQQLLTVLLNSLDTLMLGQRMEAEVVASGLANQIIFIYMVIIFGVTGGGAIFTAQYWGKNQDVPSIHKMMGIQMACSSVFALVFTVSALCFPEALMRIYSKDPAVVAMGADYLRVTAPNYLLFAVTTTYTSTLRAMGQPRLGLVMVTIAVVTNGVLNWVFIFGKWGLPAMGIQGAALATTVARCVEVVGMLFLVYHHDMLIAARWESMFSFTKPLLRQFFKVVSFVIAVEASWSIGTSLYNIAYKALGTDAQAAVQLAGTFQNASMIFAIGLGNACAVMVGHLLGAGDEDGALTCAKRMSVLSLGSGLGLGAVVAVLTPWLVQLFEVCRRSAEVGFFTRNMLYVIAAVLPIRCLEYMIMIGILRAGGDTKFSLVIDVVAVWGVGVPLAFLAVYVFHWPVYLVALLVNSEILCKCIVCGARAWNRKWMRRLV